MKARYVVLLMLGAMLITGGAITFGYLLSQDSSDEEEAKSKTAVNGATDSGLQVSGNNNGTGQLLQSDEPSLDGNSPQPSSENNLPGPDQFELYEQYANESNALYADVAIGTGAEAVPGDSVALVYTGYLTDGTIFDQSRAGEDGRVQAFSFQLGQGQVIRGWEEGIPGMQVGGKRRLVIPSAAAYGEAGQGQIPPNATLIFDVELVQIQAADQQSGL